MLIKIKVELGKEFELVIDKLDRRNSRLPVDDCSPESVNIMSVAQAPSLVFEGGLTLETPNVLGYIFKRVIFETLHVSANHSKNKVVEWVLHNHFR